MSRAGRSAAGSRWPRRWRSCWPSSLLGVAVPAAARARPAQPARRDAAPRAPPTSRSLSASAPALLTAPRRARRGGCRRRLVVEVVDRTGADRRALAARSAAACCPPTRSPPALIRSGHAALRRRAPRRPSRCASTRRRWASSAAGRAAGGAVIVAVDHRRDRADTLDRLRALVLLAAPGCRRAGRAGWRCCHPPRAAPARRGCPPAPRAIGRTGDPSRRLPTAAGARRGRRSWPTR